MFTLDYLNYYVEFVHELFEYYMYHDTNNFVY